jgi:hypothetical protein
MPAVKLNLPFFLLMLNTAPPHNTLTIALGLVNITQKIFVKFAQFERPTLAPATGNGQSLDKFDDASGAELGCTPSWRGGRRTCPFAGCASIVLIRRETQ